MPRATITRRPARCQGFHAISLVRQFALLPGELFRAEEGEQKPAQCRILSALLDKLGRHAVAGQEVKALS